MKTNTLLEQVTKALEHTNVKHVNQMQQAFIKAAVKASAAH